MSRRAIRRLTAAAVFVAMLGTSPVAGQPRGPEEGWRQALELEAAAHRASGSQRASLAREAFNVLWSWAADGHSRSSLELYCVTLAKLSLLAFWFDQDITNEFRLAVEEDEGCRAVRMEGQSIAGLLLDRLGAPARGSRAEHGGGFIEVNHSKGGIQVTMGYARVEPLAAEERRLLLARRARTATLDDAEALGRSLLRDAGIPYRVARRGDTLVFGAGAGSGASEALAATVEDMRRTLERAYFPSGRRQPLVVYANLVPGGELEAQRLSEALHFRRRSGLEAYFQPLDRSIVLRKNILTRSGELYLGTAQHELAHALMAREAPDAPFWLDEGLASLHEETSGGLKPRDNYRYYYLEAALEFGALPPVSELLEADSSVLATEEGRLLAAMARYFALFLWQRDQGRLLAEMVGAAVRAPEGQDLRRESVRQLLASTGAPSVSSLDGGFRRWLVDRGSAGADRRWSQLRGSIYGYVAGLAQGSGPHPGFPPAPPGPAPFPGPAPRPQPPPGPPPPPPPPLPRAAAEPDGPGRYLFSLWLEMDPALAADVASVAYRLDPLTFRESWTYGTDPRSGFVARYRGWGCLRRVGIVVTLRDGRRVELPSFDMCAALGW